MLKVIPLGERQIYKLEMGLYHLLEGNLTMAYDTMAKTDRKYEGATAGQVDPHQPFLKAMYCGLIRYLQWAECLRADAAKGQPPLGAQSSKASKGLPFDTAAWHSSPAMWQRMSQQSRDYWSDACKHLKEAMSAPVSPWGRTALVYLMAHLQITAGRPDAAVEAARQHAEAAPRDPDALALPCLLLYVVGRRKGAGQPAKGEEPLEGGEGLEEGWLQRLAEAHLRLMACCPDSAEAFEGVWMLREHLPSASDLVEAALLHADTGAACWGRLGEALQRLCKSHPSGRRAGDSGSASLRRVGRMLSERQSWWGRCHFWELPRPPPWDAAGDGAAELCAKATCAGFVLGVEHEWYRSAVRCLEAGGAKKESRHLRGVKGAAHDLRLSVIAAHRTSRDDAQRWPQPPSAGSAAMAFEGFPESWRLLFPAYRRAKRARQQPPPAAV